MGKRIIQASSQLCVFTNDAGAVGSCPLLHAAAGVSFRASRHGKGEGGVTVETTLHSGVFLAVRPGDHSQVYHAIDKILHG